MLAQVGWLTLKDALPADGPEQGGAGLVVEGDDDAGGRQVPAVHQQRASGGERRETAKTFGGKADGRGWNHWHRDGDQHGQMPGVRWGKTPGPYQPNQGQGSSEND